MVSLVYRRVLETPVLSDYFLNEINQLITKYSKCQKGKIQSAIRWHNGGLHLNWDFFKEMPVKLRIIGDKEIDRWSVKDEMEQSKYRETICKTPKYQWVMAMTILIKGHSGWKDSKGKKEQKR